ncbi:MAG: hypothetical protein JO323_26685 [Acidobacteriia bacterium]|nr:hypothetical protein [Terriglobia bacterium]
MKFRIFSILNLAAFASLLQAQQGTVSGPVTGYIFDPTARALRPVLGLPGASLFGSPIGFGLEADSAFVAPSLDSAVVVAGDGTIHLFSIQSGAVKELSAEGLKSLTKPLRVVFSPSGSAAALYAAGSVVVLKGLPSAPAIAASVPLAVNAGASAASSGGRRPEGRVIGKAAAASPLAIAVSDDAAALLVSTGNAIRLFGSGDDLGKLMDASDNPSMAFAAGGHDAAIADSGAGVVLFHDVLGTGGSQVISPPDASNAVPSALAFSSDGKAILLAESAAQIVTELDLAAGSRTRIPCSCSPTLMARMGQVFRLTEQAHDPLWLLDTPASGPRVVFVPALQP